MIISSNVHKMSLILLSFSITEPGTGATCVLGFRTGAGFHCLLLNAYLFTFSDLQFALI